MGFSFDYLFQGFATALTLQNLFWALVGCFIGTLVGVLPGIGPVSGIAILLPLTTVLPPTSAIIMMAAIYYGAMYGGSTTAIVVNIPGEASSVPTAIDGYEMAKQGKAGPALAISAISSFVAGTLSVIALTFFAPMLAEFAVVFGPPEYFALMFMGLSLVISLSGRALLKGVISMALGLTAALIGQDPLTGASRLTFGTVTLNAGVDFISVIVGLFAISEVMINVEQRITAISEMNIKNWMPTWRDIKQCSGAMIRATGVGFFLGLLPGCAPSVTTFVAYDLEKRVSKHPERFGHGAIEGVAAPEAANNATSTAGFVPLFSFGLPTAPSMAVLLGGLMMYGLQPGPMLFAQNPQFVWAVIASMYIGNVMLLILNLPLVGMWAKIVRIPFYILGPMIVFCAVVGTYSIRFQLFDVWVMLLFG
ncbi:MAG: transporter, partial [Syntrophus sp. (in: bacteria)]|nr:transporter [Syntrophus sp. (in: bacteria)]